MVVLLVSGGHTMLVLMEELGRYRLLGQTVDDAAGEAFDKVARYLGLGYPGGPAIDRLAMEGDPKADPLPPADARVGLRLLVLGPQDRGHQLRPQAHRRQGARHAAPASRRRSSTCWSPRPGRRRSEHGVKAMALGGGVAANSALREQFLDACTEDGIHGFLPSRSMCTDNAAMVAAAGWWRLRSDGPTPLDVGADPNMAIPGLR